MRIERLLSIVGAAAILVPQVCVAHLLPHRIVDGLSVATWVATTLDLQLPETSERKRRTTR